MKSDVRKNKCENMILRATNKLAQKLKIKSLQKYDSKVSAFEEWYGNVFTADRVTYILFTNAFSLYSVILPGKGINNIRLFCESINFWLPEVLKEEECENMVNRFISNNSFPIDICKTINRGVLGSMNDMISNSKFYFTQYQLSPIEISKKMNEIPYSYLKYKNPLSVVKQMALS
ncbi:MAG: DUF6933 domain-containing protein [Ignavibacteriaceae bacterium]